MFYFIRKRIGSRGLVAFLVLVLFLAVASAIAPATQASDISSEDLQKAIAGGDTDLLKGLLEKDPGLATRTVDLRSFHFPPLTLAKDRRTAELLIEKGADVNGPETVTKMTPLHWAASRGKTELVEYYVSLGATVNARSITGDTPLHEATRSGYMEIVKYLVMNGADLSLRGNAEMTPFDKACSGGHLEMAQYLAANGSDVNSGDSKPILWASRYGHVPVVRYLLSVGADVNVRNDYGTTPLHAASENGYPELVEFLLAEGANPDVKDSSGKTPADVADKKEIEDLLKRAEPPQPSPTP